MFSVKKIEMSKVGALASHLCLLGLFWLLALGVLHPGALVTAAGLYFLVSGFVLGAWGAAQQAGGSGG